MIADYVNRGAETQTPNLGLTQVNQNEAFDDPVLDAVNSNAAVLDNAAVIVRCPRLQRQQANRIKSRITQHSCTCALLQIRGFA